MLFFQIRLLFLCIFLLTSSSTLEARYWHPLVEVDTSSSIKIYSSVDMNADNQSVAVWYDFSDNALYSADYDYATDSWSASIPLATSTFNIILSGVIIDPSGTATALWHAGDSSSGTLYSAQKPWGGIWTTPAIITSPTDSILVAQFKRSENGDFVALWAQEVGTTTVELYSSTLLGGTWSAPVLVSVAGENVANEYSLAIDNDGNVLAMWTVTATLTDPTFIRAAYKPVSSPWQAPVQLTAASPGFLANNPQAIFDSSGNAYALFSHSQDNGATFSVYYADLPFGGPWTIPQILTTYAGASPSNYNIVIDPSDNITAAWDPDLPAPIVSSRRPSGQTWTTPVDIVPNGFHLILNLGVDAVGNVILAYTTLTLGVTELNTIFSPVGGGWNSPNQIVMALSLFGFVNQLAVSPNGNALLVFITVEGSTTPLQSSLFANDPVAPPTAISGVQKVNCFLTQRDYYNVLHWAAPTTGIPPASYNIYRSSNLTQIELVARVPGNVHVYEDHKRTKHITYTYSIVAVDADGNLSDPVIIIVHPN